MSFYNLMNGINPATVFIFPCIGLDIHPQDFPRFRDCFISEDGKEILVYTRMGGGNSGCWEDGADDCDCPACTAREYENMENCKNRKDDFYDRTYCTFYFKPHPDWEEDFEKIKKRDIKNISEEHKKEIIEIFPKLKELLKKLFYEGKGG